MFRQEEVFIGGWHEKTLESMQRRRFENAVAQLAPLGAARLEEMTGAAFARRIEQSWQSIERKPMRRQQISQVRKSVISTIQLHADCLSKDEHDLVERALILGGNVQIEDIFELEAAKALSLRLWANVGLVSGKPYIELEPSVIRPAAKAFAGREHELIRSRLSEVGAYLSGTLYRVGMMDDFQPQRMILSEALHAYPKDDLVMQIARRHLWASYDCMDYSGGVMLIHPALADPRMMMSLRQRRIPMPQKMDLAMCGEILPEEIPLQQALERTMKGALREGMHAQDVARNIRFLCKQGAPIVALEEVLQNALIVHISPSMKGALMQMYLKSPKWIECAQCAALQ